MQYERAKVKLEFLYISGCFSQRWTRLEQSNNDRKRLYKGEIKSMVKLNLQFDTDFILQCSVLDAFWRDLVPTLGYFDKVKFISTILLNVVVRCQV